MVKPETMHKLHDAGHHDAAEARRAAGHTFAWRIWAGVGGSVSVDWAPTPLGFHGGSNTRMIAQIWVDPSADFAMVLMTNIGGHDAEEGLIAVAAELYPASSRGRSREQRSGDRTCLPHMN